MEEFCFDILTAVILIFRTSTYEMNGPIFWVSYTVNMYKFAYDAVSDVVESFVQWRLDFQIGSTVLKNC